MRKLLKSLLAAGAILLAAQPAFADGRTPLPSITEGKGDRCVEPTEVMRRDHMEMILHQRDRTMHQGIRTTKYSLKECIGCHAQKDAQGHYIPVTDEGQFCQSCHSYAAVTIDCFQCHATKPLE
jgi:hypothetical protein